MACPQDAAGQLRKSPHQFSGIGSQSPLLWLARGYAVLDGPTMPIVAEGDDEGAEPNDTYIAQLVASARAAVQARTSAAACSSGTCMCAHWRCALRVEVVAAHLEDAVDKVMQWMRTCRNVG